MLVSTLISDIRNIVGDENSTRWTDAKIIRLISLGQKDICKHTNALRASKDLIVYTGQSNYSLPNDLKTLTRALYNGTHLIFKSHSDLDISNTKWETITGTPTNIIYDRLNRGIVKIFPTPDFIENSPFILEEANLLTVFYIRRPIELTHSTNNTELSEEYELLLHYYVSAQLLRYDEDAQNRQFGAEQLMLYNAELLERKKESITDYQEDASTYQTNYRNGFNVS